MNIVTFQPGIYDAVPVAVYTCGPQNQLLSYNPAALQLFDVAPQLGSMVWYPDHRFYEADGALLSAENGAVIFSGKGEMTGREILARTPGNEFRELWVSSGIIHNPGGRSAGTICTFIDVTKIMPSERQASILSAIIDFSDDAIISKDLDGIITSWNRGAEVLFGYSAAEAIGRHISLIIPINRIAEEKLIIEKVRNLEPLEHFETIRLTKQGREIPISLTISPIKNRQGEIVGASKIARDISRQKLAEERLQVYASHLEELVEDRTWSLKETVRALELAKDELNRSLEKEKELSKLKSRFVSMASHEFRTPLSAVKLSALLIQRYVQEQPDERIVKHARKIVKSVGDMSAILSDFLSLEKLESGKLEVSFQPLDLPKFCTEMIEEMQALAKQGQQINYVHIGDQHEVSLDENLLRNCVNNLLSNAIKYSAESTVIDLSTEASKVHCRLVVKDNGIGIPEGEQNHIFEAFFRAGNTSSIQGTGLGLNIVARYAGLMGGTISFVSSPGRGTEFTLDFALTPLQV